MGQNEGFSCNKSLKTLNLEDTLLKFQNKSMNIYVKTLTRKKSDKCWHDVGFLYGILIIGNRTKIKYNMLF